MESFASRLKHACKGINFVSETDSGVEPVFGAKTQSASSADVLTAIGVSAAEHFEEREFEKFFSRLIAEKDWFTESQRKNAKRFGTLKRLLETDLTNLKVIRVGKIHVTIYVLGCDSEGNVAGVKMNAIET